MKKITTLFLAGVAIIPAAASAQNADRVDRWYVRPLTARFIFDEAASVAIGGQQVAGTSAKVDDNTSPGVEMGYFMTPEISVSATIGLPPKTSVTATGTLASFGKLGSVRYGPGIYTLNYHFGRPGGIRPYVGAGINWTIIFRSEDAALKNLHARNTTGPVVKVGIEAPETPHIGIFVAGAKAWTSSNVTFDAPTPEGLVPGSAKLTLNPLVVYGGLSVHF
jgi:outer membrane protein